MKKKLHEVVALFVVLAQILSVPTVFSHGEETEGADLQFECPAPNPQESIQSEHPKQEIYHELTVVSEADCYPADEIIRVQFNGSGVVDYSYETQGITVIGAPSDLMGFNLIAEDEFGSIDVCAIYDDGTTAQSSVYTYRDGDRVYLSEIGKDVAWHNCMEERYNQGEISMAEWEDAYSELSRTFVVEIPPANTAESSIDSSSLASTSSTGTTTVKGTLQWQLNDGTLLPLRQTKVELRDKEPIDSREIATSYTDNNGAFSFTFDNSTPWYDFENGGLDVFVRWYTESERIVVKHDFAFIYNYFDSSVRENVQTGSTTEFNYYVPYDESNNVNCSFFVLQGMVLGDRYARSRGFTDNNIVRVMYPWVQGDTAGSFYGFIGVGKERFNQFDTLVHEYGHYVEQKMGNYGATLDEIIYNDPTHYSYTDHFSDKKQKEYAMELTWSEAWATTFSQLAQEYYKTEYVGVPGFADGCNIKTISEDKFLSDTNSCEAQEDAVSAFLWDLYDSGSDEAFDRVSWGHSKWWAATTREGTCTLTAFMNVIDQYYPNERSNIGSILAAHQISPANVMVTNIGTVSTIIPPQLSWKVNGSIDHPNDRFKVSVYSASGEHLFTTREISCSQAYNTTFHYTMAQNDWIYLINKVILTNYGTFKYNICIQSYRSGEPLSGPYPSQYFPVTVRKNGDFTTFKNSRYNEYSIHLESKGYCDITVTFATAGSKLLQTFGTKDTYMEVYNSEGTLLESDDDDGYSNNSFIRRNFAANTAYRIRIRFYSSADSGSTKLVITPTTWLIQSGSSSISCFEDIWTVTGRTNYNLSTSIAQNSVKAMVFTPPSAGSYTVETTGSIDTYIYLLNPRSSAPITSSDYNDNGGAENNARLTKTLEAGVPYLIFYSAYNISSGSTGSIMLTVAKG